MKKSLLALAVLGTFAGAASAQSSVTLFGNIDINLRGVKTGDESIKTLSKNGYSSSAIGVRGVEDLGGGLRAGFHLEGDLDPDTGNPGGQSWQRRSTVSLIGGFGEIRLGRDYTPTFWNHTVFDLWGTNGTGGQTNLMTQAGDTIVGSGATTLVRANNSIGYHLPSGLGGLYGQLMVAAGEGTNANKYLGGRVGWTSGPINVAAAYGKTDLGEEDLKAFNLAGSYNFGFMTLLAQYHMYEFAENKQKNISVQASVPIGAGQIKASYGKVSDYADANQIAVGYLHSLSKRTFLYAHYSRIDNDDNAAFRIPSQAALAVAGGGLKSTGYELGVRHTF